jgi:hypothetical protein
LSLAIPRHSSPSPFSTQHALPLVLGHSKTHFSSHFLLSFQLTLPFFLPLPLPFTSPSSLFSYIPHAFLCPSPPGRSPDTFAYGHNTALRLRLRPKNMTFSCAVYRLYRWMNSRKRRSECIKKNHLKGDTLKYRNMVHRQTR